MRRYREARRTVGSRRRRWSVTFPGVTLALTLAAANVSAQSQWDVLLHASAISYQDSKVKDDGWVSGFYGTYGAGWKHLVEVAATRTGIKYLDGWDLRQTDVTLAYSRFGAGGSGRLGVHFVASDDVLTDGGLVLFGGASRYEVGVWSAGAEVALSHFPDYDGGLVVSQVAPSVGFTVLSSASRVLAATLRGYAIRLSEDVGLGDTQFLSAEIGISLTSGVLVVSGYDWGGEQVFGVRSGGLTVFNLAELHTAGYGGGMRWTMTPRSALSAGFYLERLRDLEVPGDAWARTFSVSLGLTL